MKVDWCSSSTRTLPGPPALAGTGREAWNSFSQGFGCGTSGSGAEGEWSFSLSPQLQSLVTAAPGSPTDPKASSRWGLSVRPVTGLPPSRLSAGAGCPSVRHLTPICSVLCESASLGPAGVRVGQRFLHYFEFSFLFL